MDRVKIITRTVSRVLASAPWAGGHPATSGGALDTVRAQREGPRWESQRSPSWPPVDPHLEALRVFARIR